MTAYTNTRDNNVSPGAGYKDGDTLTTVNGSKWIWQNDSWHPIVFGGDPEEQPLTVRRSDGEVVFDAPTTAAVKKAAGAGPHVSLNVSNPTNVRKSIIFPSAATHVTAYWRQGTGSAATGGALFLVAGAGGDTDAATKLAAGGGRMTLLLGKCRRISLVGLASQRLDWITASAETGSAELVLDFEVPAPVARGVDVINAPLSMLSTDAQPYDESGNGNHLTQDAGLSAAAASANPGYLTTAVSTTTAQFVSIPASVFNKLNADSGDSYLLRFTADLTPPAAVCGIAGTFATSGNGWKLFAWSDGRIALVVSAGGVQLAYDGAPAGTIAAGVERNYSVYVDGANKKIYAWADNLALAFGQSYAGAIHTGLKCRIGGDTDTRGLTGKWRNLRYVNCNGMTVNQVMDLVEYLNLLSGV